MDHAQTNDLQSPHEEALEAACYYIRYSGWSRGSKYSHKEGEQHRPE